MDRDGRDEGQEVVPTSSDTLSGANPNGTEGQEEELTEAFGLNAGFVEEIRERYQVDPGSVDPSWNDHFARGRRAPRAERVARSSPRPPAQGREVPRIVSPPPVDEAAALEQDRSEALDPRSIDRHARVLRLIHAYRSRGHRIAKSDPLEGQSTYFPELDPAHYGFGTQDLESRYTAGDLPGGGVQSLGRILDRLEKTYCGSIGVEFTQIQDPGRKTWLQQRMEATENRPDLTDAEKRRTLQMLSSAELFERFLHTKFIGQKRFSLEGAESTIPALDFVVEESPRFGIREVVLGMTHRGRLNVLSNILGKSYAAIFSEFEDSSFLESPFGSGDVKYHKGFSSDRRVRSGERIHLTLTSNPSHLEAVDPVVIGRAKAKQVRSGDTKGKTILPVILHGDAAFAGQGMVAETLNLSQLRGYSTGGTLHIVVNNQIGFTTTPAEARSTLYCTDVAKMIQIPIFHVNGDDPESVVYCVRLAMAYRERFGDDVVIDLVCYRRQGHNEGDEPSFTQPQLYEKIKKRPSVRKLYLDRLVESGVLSLEAARDMDSELGEQLKQALEVIQSRPPEPDEPYEPRGPWEGYSRTPPDVDVETAVPVEQLAKVADGLGRLPQGFRLHPKLQKLVEERCSVARGDVPIDWGLGEALAFGSLLLEGTSIRLSGEDSSRGTFSHRHAVFVDQETSEEYAPLDHLDPQQARFEVYDSLLSELAVLGFEYGYSLASPGTLTIWEAQFGDFANGAQVIIDQFITSAPVKWGRMSGLVLLLPHGYEGQGPEHSSARVERFLQLCAEDALQVANCTTPAQYFHLLRRQMRRNYRSPLVLFSPKSLLRLPAARSCLADLTGGRFESVLADPESLEAPERVCRVIFCSGKVYYDLVVDREKRRGERAGEIAILRIEELYPWPEASLREHLDRYPNARSFVWLQEEPQNMGPWTFVRDRLEDLVGNSADFSYAGRPPSASPAVGSARIHRVEQAALLESALEGAD
ncbi:MAG: 2-oxoglutarate dehydrogenase E1 component [Myxococcota bacterium]|nr:2-oxoglutarate dehydrogenase E1 component [Myxococcota bacterium]